MKSERKILVVDDEASIRKFLRVSLQNDGFSVIEAASGQEAIRELVFSKPMMMILDLGLPDMDGFEVIQKVREWSNIPILVLTVKEEEENKVRVLDGGADDYLTKPFSVPELLARLRVAERHLHAPLQEQSLFQSGPLSVDLAGHLVTVNGKEIHLTATEYAMLALFIKHAGKVVTHRHILKEVWGPHAIEHTQYLRVYVGQLRKKIEPDDNAQKLLITEPGVGYRLLLGK